MSKGVRKRTTIANLTERSETAGALRLKGCRHPQMPLSLSP